MFTNSVISNESGYFIKKLFRPNASYKFPTMEEYNKSRSFQHTWIKQYSWLSYSQSLNGGFCKNCFLFAKNRSLLAHLFTQPITCFTQTKTTLQEHNLQLTHKMAMDDSMALMGQMECGHLSIQQQLQNIASITKKKKSSILKSVLKAINFVVNRIYLLEEVLKL